jgi:LysM repeat protein
MPAGPASPPSDAAKLIYQVKRGDSLFTIARLFQTSVNALKVWNHLTTNNINPGDRLTIFTSRQTTAGTPRGCIV